MIDGLQIERAVDVQIAVAVDGVTQRHTVVTLRTANPGITGIIGGIAVHPLQIRQFVQGQLITGGDLLLVVEGRTQVLDTVPHGVFPGRIPIRIEVFVHRGIRLFDLRMGGRLEVEVQVLREVPAQGEVTVPEELRVEGKRQTVVVEILHVTLLQFVVTAGDLGVKGDALRQVVQSEGPVEVLPLLVAFHLLERLPRLIHRRIGVVQGTPPLVFLLIDGGLTRGKTVGMTVTEREVGWVVRHRMPLRLQSPAHVGDGEVGVGGTRHGDVLDTVALLLVSGCIQRLIETQVTIQRVVTRFDDLLTVGVIEGDRHLRLVREELAEFERGGDAILLLGIGRTLHHTLLQTAEAIADITA